MGSDSFLKKLQTTFILGNLNNSIARLSYGANPVTSLTRSLTNLLWLVCLPLLLDGLGFKVLGVVLWPLSRPVTISYRGAIVRDSVEFHNSTMSTTILTGKAH